MLTTYHHPVPLSRNLGALTSWNPLGLSRPVMGLLYLFFLQDWVPHNFRSLRTCSPRMTETFASLGSDCFFFFNRILMKDFLLSLASSLFRSSGSTFLWGELVKIAADFRKCCMFRWLFMFPAKYIWNKTNVRGQKNNSALFWGRRSDCWLAVCGFVPLEVGYSFSILAHGTEISSNNSRCCAEILPGLCALNVMVARKQACLP